MTGKQITGDALSANIAGMSKSQLYDIMSQMKTLIEQNQQQARQILVQNPALTRALFQAQIMLGMVQPPQVASIPQQSQPSAQPPQQPPTQAPYKLPGQPSDQASASQIQIPSRKQQQNQSALPILSSSLPASDFQSQSMPSQPLKSVPQHKGHLSAQVTPSSLPQSTQIPNIPLPPLHSVSQPSSQLQPLQPPLPPQPRPPSSMPPLSRQFHSQAGPNMGFQPSGRPQLHHSQPMFHSGNKPPGGVGPSFPQAQQSHPSQAQPQSMYQMGGSNLGTEFSNQAGNSMQVDRGSSWMPGQPENTVGLQLPGLPPFMAPTQMGPGNQPPRAPSLSPEMEKALLQQVMSLTPEQINLLPPEQRHQVLQLQQMLRQ